MSVGASQVAVNILAPHIVLTLLWIEQFLGGFLLVSSVDNICKQFGARPSPKVIKRFSYSTQLSTKFILLINVKMPTIVGILTFISSIKTTSESIKAENLHFSAF